MSLSRSGVRFLPVALAVALASVACAKPKEPKQASAPDPVEETEASDSANGVSSSSGSSSSGSKGGADLASPPSGGPVGKASKGEPTPVGSLATFQDGLRWGMSHADVTKVHTQNGGVIWKDYDQRLGKARVGPEMTAIENEREQAKAAFGRSYVEFKDTPTGYDATGIRGEYTYKNKESLMWLNRQGKKRFFFFINDRLWKIYDEVPLTDSGIYGNSFVDAANTLNGQLGAQGRIVAADANKGINATTVDWKDGTSHLRLVDRSGEKLVGLALEDNATLSNLATLRSNKSDDPTAIDPSVAAVTGGANRTDPNAPAPAASGKPAAKPAPKKK